MAKIKSNNNTNRKAKSKTGRDMSVRPGGAAEYVLNKIIAAYMFIILAVYPLYYHDKYYDMDSAKWGFFKIVSIVALVAAAVAFLAYIAVRISRKNLSADLKEIWAGLDMTDRFALLYAVIAVISALITPYKENVIWGYEGWYMGLVMQLGFVLLYFVVSRFYRCDRIYLFICMCAPFIVFLLGVLMRFRVDPLSMYEGLEEQYIETFLSTLGQITWYSSYLCIILPLGVIMYWKATVLWQKVVFGIFSAVGFMSAVTQNSDSAYMALGGIFVLLLIISLDSYDTLIRYLEVLMIALGSFKFIGLLQIALPARTVRLDRLSIFLSQSIFTLIMFLAVIALYIALKAYVKKNPGVKVKDLHVLKTVIPVAILVCVVLGIIYIALNSTGRLPGSMSSENNYLLFNDAWGNNRGVSWRCAWQTFCETDVVRKLFGAGPDSFAEIVYKYHKADMDSVWTATTILTCAHNEWLNALINVGILGLIGYLGIFISSMVGCIKNARKSEKTEIYGVAIAILAYILHNSFCYQQILCTPVIFILMGMASSLARYGYDDELGR